MQARTKPSGGLRRRSLPTDNQEQQSEGQFIARLGEIGWKPFEPRRDTGEDAMVQIWDGGASTGLSFYAQLKSVRGVKSRTTKKQPSELFYSLEVKDLEHWETDAIPVVLFVWDVEARLGYWQPISKILEQLDKSRPDWRKKDGSGKRSPRKYNRRGGNDPIAMDCREFFFAPHSCSQWTEALD